MSGKTTLSCDQIEITSRTGVFHRNAHHAAIGGVVIKLGHFDSDIIGTGGNRQLVGKQAVALRLIECVVLRTGNGVGVGGSAIVGAAVTGDVLGRLCRINGAIGAGESLIGSHIEGVDGFQDRCAGTGR